MSLPIPGQGHLQGGLPSAQHMKYIAAPATPVSQHAPGTKRGSTAAVEATSAFYVTYADDLRDLGLEMSVQDHTKLVESISTAVDEPALRRERIARLRRQHAAQAQRADREARLVEDAEQEKRDVSCACPGPVLAEANGD
jgi:hypothetical protein